ncbi:MAG: glycosyltransferase [Candidatus Omnitrophica bacterium]|nr:glycosyltransferase [Candidatus Omnitrophota bacterium]
MKVSGFTIVRNAVKFNYPVVESICSILPICDEFIVNVGDSEDSTLELIKAIGDPKIRIIRKQWDLSMGEQMLSYQTNLALEECTGDWCFYLQSDEVIHEKDLPSLVKVMRRELNSSIDVIRLRWMHFYGSFWRYRIDAGWFQKNDRIIRNKGQVESYGDAGGFRKKDGTNLKRRMVLTLLYHYGWVQPEDVMAQRRINAIDIGFAGIDAKRPEGRYSFEDLNIFPVYFGTHPAVMNKIIREHNVSNQDWKSIVCKYWYHPARIFRIRYKSFRRIKEKLRC